MNAACAVSAPCFSFPNIKFPRKFRKGKLKKDGSRNVDEAVFYSVVKIKGNGCGHNPDEPDLLAFANPHANDEWEVNDKDYFGAKRKSKFFYLADSKLNDFFFFPKILNGLGQIYCGENRFRMRRSEAREADTKVLKCLVHHMDMTTKRFGKPGKDGFEYYNLRFIMRKCGLGQGRVKRSLARLSRAGLIERQRRWVEREFGKFKALTSSTVINADLLFQQLDLMDEFLDAAKYLQEKLRQNAKDLGIKISQMTRCAVLDFKNGKPKPIESNDHRDFPDDHQKHYLLQLHKSKHRSFQLRVIDIKTAHPDLDAASIYKKAFKSLIAS